MAEILDVMSALGQKRTYRDPPAMSAKCQKRTHRAGRGNRDLLPKAAICIHTVSDQGHILWPLPSATIKKAGQHPQSPHPRRSDND